MTIVDEALLASFRHKRCAYCHRRGGTVHHVFTRATGRFDIPENLIPLCTACHMSHHNGKKPTFKALLNLVAQREGRPADDIRATIHALRRLDRDAEAEATAILAALRRRKVAHHHPGPQSLALQCGAARPAPTGRLEGLEAHEAGWIAF